MAKRESRRRVVRFDDPGDRAAVVNLGLDPNAVQIYIEDPKAETVVIGEELEACRAELRVERREFRVLAQRVRDRGLKWVADEIDAILDTPRGTYLGRRYGPKQGDRFDLATPRPKQDAAPFGAAYPRNA